MPLAQERFPKAVPQGRSNGLLRLLQRRLLSYAEVVSTPQHGGPPVSRASEWEVHSLGANCGRSESLFPLGGARSRNSSVCLCRFIMCGQRCCPDRALELLERAHLDLAHTLRADLVALAQLGERGRGLAQTTLGHDLTLTLVQAAHGVAQKLPALA